MKNKLTFIYFLASKKLIYEIKIFKISSELKFLYQEYFHLILIAYYYSYMFFKIPNYPSLNYNNKKTI